MTTWDLSRTIGRGVRRFAKKYPLLAFTAVVIVALPIAVEWSAIEEERYHSSPEGRAEQARNDAKAKAEADQYMVGVNRDMDLSGVKVWLRDPESAQFSGVRSFQRNGKRITCGFVNSRNGFGGMSGPEEFAVIAGAVALSSYGRAVRREVDQACG